MKSEELKTLEKIAESMARIETKLDAIITNSATAGFLEPWFVGIKNVLREIRDKE